MQNQDEVPDSSFPEGFDLNLTIETLERDFIQQALEASGGNIAHAGRLLGLKRTTLTEKLRRFELGPYAKGIN